MGLTADVLLAVGLGAPIRSVAQNAACSGRSIAVGACREALTPAVVGPAPGPESIQCASSVYRPDKGSGADLHAPRTSPEGQPGPVGGGARAGDHPREPAPRDADDDEADGPSRHQVALNLSRAVCTGSGAADRRRLRAARGDPFRSR